MELCRFHIGVLNLRPEMEDVLATDVCNSELLHILFFNIGGTSTTVILFICFLESDWNPSILLIFFYSLDFECVYVFIYILLECVR